MNAKSRKKVPIFKAGSKIYMAEPAFWNIETT